MLFLLLAGHALMDFALQTEAMATCKCRHARVPLQQSVPWYYWLSAHALLHGLAVALIIRVFGFDWPQALSYGIAETVVHWLIDYFKCEKWYNIHIDQLLHGLCKLIWWGLLGFVGISM